MADKRSELFKKFVWFWVSRGMRRRFYGVYAWNAERLRAASVEGPAILFSNHCSWWDAFTDHMLERLFRLNHYSLVDQRTLKTQAWLEWIGAMPLDLTNARGAVAGLRAAVDFLGEEPRRGKYPSLIIFPQGRITPAWQRPLGFQGGLSWLKKNVPHAKLIPLARRYEFLKEDRPHIFLHFGEPVDTDSTEELEAHLSRTMDCLQEKIEAGDFSDAEALLRGGMAINKKWELVQRAAKGKTREFSPLN